MGSMIDEEYMMNFLELLRYVRYFEDYKDKVKIFLSGSPLEFIDQIEYDEPQSLEEVIGR